MNAPVRNVVFAWILQSLLTACGGGGQSDESARAAEAAASPGAAIARQVPDSEILLGHLDWESGLPSISKLKNITRRAGYDNQPNFSHDGKQLFFTAIGADEQADVYRYLLAEQQTVPFAKTPESEYSPTMMPADSGISVVRVEADGTQRLWYLAAANAEARIILESVRNVGYHAWLNPNALALFIVDEPARLVIARTGDEETTEIATNIGRALARIPGENALAFIDKQEPETWRVARYDLVDGSLAELVDTPTGSEDFAWAANGGLFMGDGARLLYWDGHAGSGWVEVLDLASTFSGRITRIAISPAMDRIAIVVDFAAEY